MMREYRSTVSTLNSKPLLLWNFVFCVSQWMQNFLCELKKQYYLLVYKRIHESRMKRAAKWIFIVRCSFTRGLSGEYKRCCTLVWLNFLDFVQGMNDVGALYILIFKMRESARVCVCGKHIFFIGFLGLLVACLTLIILLYPVRLKVHCFEFLFRFTSTKNCVGHEFFSFVYRQANSTKQNKTFEHFISHIFMRCVAQMIQQESSMFNATKIKWKKKEVK